MKTLHTDSYKVPTVDSNHIVHVGGWRVLAPQELETFFSVNKDFEDKDIFFK